ncbi:hypothetical protein Q31b_31300 [Novipirellula aureliae]|uniref:Uncharacterized protein n=1 Tax=Novipirellula aureliae TaxID=2527966 RepID=A0A5C6DZ10_9BACT|nr:hypothetical protein [Novipirellula aureliae]TWU41675.1 hypothetical protein Q31b_31300 [Novipirellula aureliae]
MEIDKADPTLLDISDRRVGNLIQCGKLCNEICHRIQMLWILGQEFDEYRIKDTPCQRLREYLRNVAELDWDVIDREVRKVSRCAGPDSLTERQFERRYRINQEAIRGEVDGVEYGREHLLDWVIEELIPSGIKSNLIEFESWVFGRVPNPQEKKLLQLGIWLDRLEHPIPPSEILTHDLIPSQPGTFNSYGNDSPNVDSGPTVLQPDMLHNFSQEDWILPRLPLHSLDDEMEKKIRNEIRMRCHALGLLDEEMERLINCNPDPPEAPQGRRHLGLYVVDNELRRENSEESVPLRGELQIGLVDYIISRGASTTSNEILMKKWEHIGGTGEPEKSSISSQISKLNKQCFGPLHVKFSRTRGSYWTLHELTVETVTKKSAKKPARKSAKKPARKSAKKP